MATEIFVGAAAQLPDPPWTVVIGTVNRDGSGNAQAGSADADCVVKHASATSTTAHKSKVTLSQFDTGFGLILIVVRTSGANSTRTHYHAECNANAPTAVDLYRVINDSFSSVLKTWTIGAALEAGDTLELEVDDATPPTLTLRHNGAQVGTTFTDSGGTYPTGTQVGFGFFAANPNSVRVSQWDGSDVGAGDPAPELASIDPDEGSESGGTVVTATGTGFVDGCTVTVGGNAATGVTFNSSTEIEFTTPAGTVGAADVVVTNPDDQSDTLVGGFTYTADGPAPISLPSRNVMVMGGR